MTKFGLLLGFELIGFNWIGLASAGVMAAKATRM